MDSKSNKRSIRLKSKFGAGVMNESFNMNGVNNTSMLGAQTGQNMGANSGFHTPVVAEKYEPES